MCVVSLLIHESHHMDAPSIDSFWYLKIVPLGYLFYYLNHRDTDKTPVSTPTTISILLILDISISPD